MQVSVYEGLSGASKGMKKLARSHNVLVDEELLVKEFSDSVLRVLSRRLRVGE